MTHSIKTAQEVTKAKQREAFEMLAWVNTTFEQAMEDPIRFAFINWHARRMDRNPTYLSENAIDKLRVDLFIKNHKADQPDTQPNT